MTAPAGSPAEAPRKTPSNLRQRVMSAVVLVVVVLSLTWAGGIWYRLLCAVIAAAVLYEWLAMTMPGQVHRIVLWAALALVLILLVAGAPAWTVFVALGLATVAGAIHGYLANSGSWPAAGVLYAGLAGLSLALIRGGDAAGLLATLFLFAVVWATDVMAYFTGRSLGGPRLAPSISPGKTWSGATGGAFFGMAGGVAVAHWGGSSAGIAAMAGIALLLSVVSQAGDLFESALKRRFSVKDSSHLIPGHGGVMDRVDGLMAAALAMVVIGMAAAGADMPAHAFFTR